MVVAALTCVKFQQTPVSGFIEDLRSNEKNEWVHVIKALEYNQAPSLGVSEVDGMPPENKYEGEPS